MIILMPKSQASTTLTMMTEVLALFAAAPPPLTPAVTTVVS
jgi:hypothetical protein